MSDNLAQQLATRLARRYAKSRAPKLKKHNAINKPPGELKTPTKTEIAERTEFTSDAPAPRLEAVVESQGPELTAEALSAWDQKLNGHALVDIAHEMKVSIETARYLIKQVQTAVQDDLKESVTQNRELDLQRIDRLIKTWYPAATGGDEAATNVMIKLLAQRAKLTGASNEQPELKTMQPQNVLVWIQNSLPGIQKIVDSLPIE